MDILKAEIERKRKLLEAKSLVGPEKKFFKREDLIKKEEEEYLKKLNEKKGNLNDENQGSSSSEHREKGTDSSGGEERILARKEVIRRLRERNEPILLFGESEIEAFKRLRKLEISEPDANDKGFRNDFQEAMEKVDQAYLNEILKSGSEKGNKGANDVNVEEMNTNIEEICQLSSNLGKRKDNFSNDCDLILKFLKFILELWGKKINSRSEDEKMSTKGKISAATYTQTQAYLRPLFKQLKSHKVADDILKHLIIIVRFLLSRDYVKASDAYLQMAIGNAPWPIGVTMVGIHARTGREKIFSQNIAHVLNDETQRKYIQALKRLMTQCQKLFPTDPSKCVEYNAFKD